MLACCLQISRAFSNNALDLISVQKVRFVHFNYVTSITNIKKVQDVQIYSTLNVVFARWDWYCWTVDWVVEYKSFDRNDKTTSFL